MRICIFGAGAVGGHMAARLAAAGRDEISVVTRGEQLAAIRARGITLRSGGKEIVGKPAAATDDPSTLPLQDVVAVTLKATAGLPAAAASIARLIAPGGVAIFLLNGIPWWWRHGLPGTPATLPLLDPEGALWTQVRPERTLGCVVYSPNDLVEPGVVVHTGANYLVFGEPDGSSSARLDAAAEAFRRGGVEVRLTPDLRREVWSKLVLNASGNTLAALTRQDLGGLGADDGLRRLAIEVMRDALAVAAAQGYDLAGGMDLEALSRRGKPGHRPSMLQDVQKSRALEVEALLGQVQGFARELKVATPAIDVILPLLRGLDRSLRAV
jgi:2-dehydropantoate 2-reductase